MTAVLDRLSEKQEAERQQAEARARRAAMEARQKYTALVRAIADADTVDEEAIPVILSRAGETLDTLRADVKRITDRRAAREAIETAAEAHARGDIHAAEKSIRECKRVQEAEMLEVKARHEANLAVFEAGLQEAKQVQADADRARSTLIATADVFRATKRNRLHAEYAGLEEKKKKPERERLRMEREIRNAKQMQAEYDRAGAKVTNVDAITSGERILAKLDAEIDAANCRQVEIQNELAALEAEMLTAAAD